MEQTIDVISFPEQFLQLKKHEIVFNWVFSWEVAIVGVGGASTNKPNFILFLQNNSPVRQQKIT